MKKITVMAFGTFGIIHPGHIYYLTEAKKLGDRLVVVVARDKNVARKKGGCPIPEEQRLVVVSALKPVDKAILGHEDDLLRVIEEIKPDIIALGPDQDVNEDDLEKELEKRGLKPKIVRIKRMTNGKLHKTSKILRIIEEMDW